MAERIETTGEPVDSFENPNPTYYDELIKRQKSQERWLKDVELPEPTLMTHAHVTSRASMVQLLFWSLDPITRERRFVRVAVPYSHFLLCARGIVDAHDESEMLAAYRPEDEADEDNFHQAGSTDT